MKSENKALHKPTGSIIEILSRKGSWILIQFSDSSTKKVRAKDLILPPGDATIAQIIKSAPAIGLVTDLKNDLKINPKTSPPTSAQSDVDNTTWAVICPECGYAWETSKTENVVCPACQHKFVIRLHADRSRYTIGLGSTETGRDTVDVNDFVANMLRGFSLDDLYEKVRDELLGLGLQDAFSKKNYKSIVDSGVSIETFLKNKYEHLNPGMQRMSLGNLLRGALTRSNTTIIE